MDGLERLASAGLSRIWQQMMSGIPFGIVSAAKDKNKLTPSDLQENETYDQSLRGLLRHFSVGFVKMDGLWQNSTVQQYLPEPSLFIANPREEDVRAIAQLFEQEAYIYGDKGYFAIKNVKTGESFLEGLVNDYVRQLTKEDLKKIEEANQRPGTHPDVAPDSKIKGRTWTFDKERGEKRKSIKQELQETQKVFPEVPPNEIVAYIISPTKLAHLQIAGGFSQGDIFYAFDREVKYVRRMGIMEDTKTDVPGGGLLEIYLPIKDNYELV